MSLIDHICVNDALYILAMYRRQVALIFICLVNASAGLFNPEISLITISVPWHSCMNLQRRAIYDSRLTDVALRVTMHAASLSQKIGVGSLPKTPNDAKRSTPRILISFATADDAANISAAAESYAVECCLFEQASNGPPIKLIT